MAKSIRSKLKAVEQALKAGKTPIIRTHLPGVEKLLAEYGLTAGVDVYVPGPNDSPEFQAKERQKFRARRHYSKRRKEIGAYLSREDRRRVSANRTLDILKRS